MSSLIKVYKDGYILYNQADKTKYVKAFVLQAFISTVYFLETNNCLILTDLLK